MTQYTDARALLDAYHREVCPECGVERWFKRLDRDHWPVAQHNCQTCGRYLRETLEWPCPECGTRMLKERREPAFKCHVEACDHDVSTFDKDAVLDRIISGDYGPNVLKPGVIMGRCPVCDSRRSVNGGPDGELECDECGKFYAGQFMDGWWAYGLWLRDPERIRVTEVHEA